jgi:hypothetical protein
LHCAISVGYGAPHTAIGQRLKGGFAGNLARLELSHGSQQLSPNVAPGVTGLQLCISHHGLATPSIVSTPPLQALDGTPLMQRDPSFVWKLATCTQALSNMLLFLPK